MTTSPDLFQVVVYIESVALSETDYSRFSKKPQSWRGIGTKHDPGCSESTDPGVFVCQNDGSLSVEQLRAL